MELKEKIREAVKSCFYALSDDIADKIVEKVHAEVSAELKQAQRWISVTESLPKTNSNNNRSVDVIAYVVPSNQQLKPYIALCHLYDMSHKTVWVHNAISVNVTHWMPLPPKPNKI